MKLYPALGAILLSAGPAYAADLRELCPERPGLDVPACTLDPGHVLVETAVADWTLDRQPDSRKDTIVLADTLVRFGVGPSTELRAGFTGYGVERERDRTAGTITKVHRAGDLTLSLKQNLSNPDGKHLSVAMLPTLTLPIGRQPIGAGTWEATLRVPATWEVTDVIQLQVTPEIEAAADEDGTGRHLAWGTAAGVQFELTKTLNLTVEVEAIRDRGPEEHQTLAVAAASVAFQVGKNLQFDVGGAAGLNHDTPDARAYWGIARRF